MRWGEGKEENRALILLIFLLKAVNFNITILSLPLGHIVTSPSLTMTLFFNLLML